MKAIIELCTRYDNGRITVLELRNGLVHELERASNEDLDAITQLILKAWEDEQW
jgi:hypothetical protein